MLLRVVDEHACGVDLPVALQGRDDQPGAFELVLQVRRVDVDELAVGHRQLDVVLERRQLVARVAVQPDLADAQHVGPVQEPRNSGEDLPAQLTVLTLLRIETEPGVVADAESGGPGRLELGQLSEVVLEAVGRAAVPPGPEGGLRQRDAAAQRHLLVVVGGPRDHVGVDVDVLHQATSSGRG